MCRGGQFIEGSMELWLWRESIWRIFSALLSPSHLLNWWTTFCFFSLGKVFQKPWPTSYSGFPRNSGSSLIPRKPIAQILHNWSFIQIRMAFGCPWFHHDYWGHEYKSWWFACIRTPLLNMGIFETWHEFSQSWIRSFFSGFSNLPLKLKLCFRSSPSTGRTWINPAGYDTKCVMLANVLVMRMLYMYQGCIFKHDYTCRTCFAKLHVKS